MEEKLVRLLAAGFEVIPASEVARHAVFTRDGFVALVEYRNEDFGAVGAAGLATEQGFAVLQWRGQEAFFVARGFEQRATVAEVEKLRAFDRDLKEALST